MKVTYIQHSGFLVETGVCYYLFDYEKGSLPALDKSKPIYVLSSHGHGDHYNPQVFTLLQGMEKLRAVLSEDIPVPEGISTLQVAPGKVYTLEQGQTLTTFLSTDLGVAFLLEEEGKCIYHAGDLNDWVWEEESDDYNTRMTASYRQQIDLLAAVLAGRDLELAFVVLDPRQEADYHRGMCYFLEQIPAKRVYPMHDWGKHEIIDTFLREYPEYRHQIQKTQSNSAARGKEVNYEIQDGS